MKDTMSVRFIAGVLASLMLLMLASCDSALEEDPSSFVGPSNFYNNKEDARAALDGAYAGLNRGVFTGYIGSYQFQTLLTKPTPEAYRGGRLDQWRWTPSQAGATESVYEYAYQGINRANAVITNVPGIENMDSQVRLRFVAEARFLRAIHYYYLAGFFGRVPIVRSEVQSLAGLDQPNAPADSVYAFVINDLQGAVENLPSRSQAEAPERATKGAAQTLLAKFYLQRAALSSDNGFPSEFQIAQSGDYQRAADLLQKVIDSGEYSLPSDVQAQFTDLFIDEDLGASNPEVIFNIQADPTVGESSGLPCLLVPGSNANLSSAGWNQYTSELPFYTSFKDEDLRKEVTFVTEYTRGSGEQVTYNIDNVNEDSYSLDTPTFTKYAKAVNPSTCDDDNDLTFLRFADALLMKAEALNEINGGPMSEAYTAINRVRERAGLEPLSGLNYETFREAVYTERRRELVSEGHDWHTIQRFFDIATRRVREHAEFDAQFGDEFGYAPALEDLEIDDPQDRFFPIPQGAFDRNPELTQNPGY